MRWVSHIQDDFASNLVRWELFLHTKKSRIIYTGFFWAALLLAIIMFQVYFRLNEDIIFHLRHLHAGHNNVFAPFVIQHFVHIRSHDFMFILAWDCILYCAVESFIPLQLSFYVIYEFYNTQWAAAAIRFVIICVRNTP